MSEVDVRNPVLIRHTALLLQSFRRWTGRDLLEGTLSPEEQAQCLFEAPFALVSHDTADDPIFNYGNQSALMLFEMTWEEFTTLPSRKSAEPVHRDERARLLVEVTQQGYIDHYQGIRISKTGNRFRIENAIVWNLRDEEDRPYGQAAMFAHWRPLDP